VRLVGLSCRLDLDAKTRRRKEKLESMEATSCSLPFKGRARWGWGPEFCCAPHFLSATCNAIASLVELNSRSLICVFAFSRALVEGEAKNREAQGTRLQASARHHATRRTRNSACNRQLTPSTFRMCPCQTKDRALISEIVQRIGQPSAVPTCTMSSP
jgi:hypothetical protein